MAEVIQVPALAPIHPDCFLDDFIATGEIGSRESAIAFGRKLGAVASNKSFLISKVNNEISGWAGGFASMYTQGSMLLSGRRGENAYLRVNFWPTIPSGSPNAKQMSLAYSYGIPHDHGFSFVTTNYFGPGYTTDLYDYDYTSTNGVLGERVELIPAGSVKLSDGVGIYFEAGRDVHVQHAPTSLTVSLNLMMYSKGDRARDQYYFDLETSTVSSFAAGAMCVRRRELVRLAALVGDENTLELLLDIAYGYPCRTTRRAAFRELIARKRPLSEKFLFSLAGDSDEVIREMARHALG